MVADESLDAQAPLRCHECDGAAVVVCHGKHATEEHAPRGACADHAKSTEACLVSMGFVVAMHPVGAPPVPLARALEVLRNIVTCADEGALDGAIFSFDTAFVPERGVRPPCHSGCECTICDARGLLKAHGLWKEPD